MSKLCELTMVPAPSCTRRVAQHAARQEMEKRLHATEQALHTTNDQLTALGQQLQEKDERIHALQNVRLLIVLSRLCTLADQAIYCTI